MTVARTFQMTRIRSGDYIVPSNDATQLWRINRYDEDGDLERGDDGTPIIGTFWRACRWDGTLDEAQEALDRDELLEWERWQERYVLLPTRQAALDAALAADDEARR